MPPKRGASKTRNPPAAVGDVDENVKVVKKAGRQPKASSEVRSKPSPIKPEVDNKPKSRGRPKKTETVAEESVPVPVEKTPVKNVRGRKAKVVEEVPEPVADIPKKARGRKPAVVDPDPEPTIKVDKKTRGRSASKSPVKKSKSPAKKATKKKSPSRKASKSPAKLAAKSPAKKAAKSPVKKAEKLTTSKTSKSRSKAVEPEPLEGIPEVEEAPEHEETEQATADIEETTEPVKGKRGRKAKSETAQPPEPKPAPNKRGRKPASKKVPAIEEPQVDVEKMESEPPVESATQQLPDSNAAIEIQPPTETKSRGRPKKIAPAPEPSASVPKTVKPRGRQKASPKTTEPSEKVQEDSLTNLVDSAPVVAPVLKVTEIPTSETSPSNDVPIAEAVAKPLLEEVRKTDVPKEQAVVKEADKVKVPVEVKVPEELPAAASTIDAGPMEVEEDASRVNKRKLSEEVVEESQAKKAKAQVLPVVQLPKIVGRLMTCGTDNVGELGFRRIGGEKLRPYPVDSVKEPVCLVAAGAMHTVAVSVGGTKVYTFGCNDELALGRKTTANGTAPPPSNTISNPVDPDETIVENEDEIPEAIPTSFRLPNNIVKVTAGDSHTAALTEHGVLYIWGCFRDVRGRIGLIPDGKLRSPIGNPVAVPIETTVADIASGDNHVIALTETGAVYSFGVGEQGQLGRIPEPECKINDDYSNVELFLKPQQVTIDGNPDIKCDRVWAAGFITFVRTTEGAVYAWGLNNYSQLGFPQRGDIIVEALPKLVTRFCDSVESITGGLHHTLARDAEGRVYSWGRHEYGRLGHSELMADVQRPRLIESLKHEKVSEIACGTDCSFAVTESGNLYSWGRSEIHLGHTMPGDDEEGKESNDVKEPRKVTSKRLANTNFFSVSSGSQHAVFIASSDQQNGN